MLSRIAADPGRASRLRVAALLGMVLGRLSTASATLTRIAAGEGGVVSDAARAALAALPAAGAVGPSDEGPLIFGSLIDPQGLVRDMTEALVQRHPPAGQRHP